MNVILFGAGGNAKNCYKELRSQGYDVVCFVDSNPCLYEKEIYGLPVLSLDTALKLYNNAYFFITPISSIKYEIMQLLIKREIAKERILNYEDGIVYRKGCNSLENVMILANKEIHYCCSLGNLRPSPPPPHKDGGGYASNCK